MGGRGTGRYGEDMEMSGTAYQKVVLFCQGDGRGAGREPGSAKEMGRGAGREPGGDIETAGTM